MFKCVYRKSNGAKDFVFLDGKNRERAFMQAKDLGLTVVEMIPCGRPETKTKAKTERSEPDALTERRISFWVGFFLPFLLTNVSMAFVFRLRGFVWSIVGSFMLIPAGFFLYSCFAVGNIMRSGRFTGLLVWIPLMLAAGAVFWLPFRLMKSIGSRYL